MANNYTLTYRGVTLPLTQTTLEQDFIYDPSGVDRMWNHCVITAQSILNTATLGVTPDVFINQLRTSYSEPRGYLQYMLDGRCIVCTGSTGDAKNGPQVTAHAFQMNGSTVIATVRIETWLNECATPQAVISNRWSQTHDIDADGMTIITNDGSLVVRTDMAVSPDSFRHLIYPVAFVPFGFSRTKYHFNQTSDNTTLNWTTVDEEKLRPGVDGITRWEAEWVESSDVNRGVGALVQGNINAWAAGPKTLSKADIFTFLAKVCLSRVEFGANKDRLLAYEVHEKLHVNEMAVNMQVLCQSASQSASMPMTFRIGNKVYPLDTSTNYTLVPPRGTALATMFLNAVTTTCGDKTGNPTTATYSVITPTNSGSDKKKTDTTPSSERTNPTSTEQKSKPYIRYNLESHYKSAGGAIQLPLSGLSSSGSTSVIAAVSLPVTHEIVNFHAERLDVSPDLPSTTNDTNKVLMDAKITLFEQRMAADQLGPILSLAGWWKYALKSPVIPGSGMSTLTYPTNPLFDSSVQGASVTGTNFNPTITA